MPISNEPFQRYNTEKKVDTFTVKFNEQERKEHEELKKILNQEKDSTAIKQLASIGAKVVLSGFFAHALNVVTDNKRKNQRLGIITFD